MAEDGAGRVQGQRKRRKGLKMTTLKHILKVIFNTKLMAGVFVIGFVLMLSGPFLNSMSPKMSYRIEMEKPAPPPPPQAPGPRAPEKSVPEEGFRPKKELPKRTPVFGGNAVPDMPDSIFNLGKWFSFIGGLSLIGKMICGFFSKCWKWIRRKKKPIAIEVNREEENE